jgi:transcriptional regulator with XRE-family HTH domain
MDVLARRIRERRENKNISQSDLGKAVGVGNSTISNYESGYSSPDAETLKYIANVLETTSDYLLGNIDKPDIPNLKTSLYSNGKLKILEAADASGLSDDAIVDLINTFSKLAKDHNSG